ncbi:MAG: polyphosphate:AMP phosphotransferase [Lachnospiraceae bacterium]|nr:polyphosphate:AMP phosphotransferase [Lachnospiraceae bacterium]MCX4375084.1 polyphosphate:AMP phosphotransferase [Lachnospiraceae bacterium]
MLEKIDLTKSLKKKEYKKRMAKLESKIAFLQRELKNLGVPVMIVFEGFGAAGKGTQINRLIQALDPRGFTVYSTDAETKDEKMHPFLWRFWTKTPEKGRIAVFDRSWYRKLLVDRYEKKTSKKEIPIILEEISSFEKQLTDGGTLVMKFFLDISEREQKKRFHKLMEKKATSWRVSDKDLDRNKHFQDYLEMADEMLTKTDSDYAPWTIVEAEDDRYATVKILSTVAAAFEDRYKKEKESKKKEREVDGRFDKSELNDSVLKKVDLSKKMEEKAYEKRLDELQKKLRLLHGKLYAKRIPVVLAFEGWDAGGKGGAIKRLTNALDPRGYTVNPTSSPNDIERAHHYLWRFWTKMPKDGHIAIFDRTWYGRVMVERIEGFCTTQDWQRAYKEINQMEQQLVNHGAVVLKFWLHIDKEEQARRFQDRQDNPEKSWKITDEDWRNREKWDLYEKAVDEMLVRTSTADAPWIIVEGNDKLYARIKVLETVVNALEKRMKKS